MLNDREIAALVAELDALVPREGARLQWLFGERGDPCCVGNRLGYLRLGVELLKVADAAPSSRHPHVVLADLSYLGGVAVDPGDLAIFTRHEPALAAPAPGQSSAVPWPGGVVAAVVVFLLVLALVVGLVTMLGI